MSSLTPSWFEEDSPRDLMRWVVAAAFVVVIHAGAIALYIFWHQPEAEIGDDAEIVTVELAPIDSTPDAVARDDAPAPETMIESKALPEPQKEKPREELKVEQPPDETPSNVPMPVVKPPEQAEVTPPPAPHTAQQVKGGAPRIEASWQTSLLRQLQRFKRYPAGAQSRNEQGVVLLSFSLDRTGHVLAHSVARSSGFPDLDNEVMALIMRAEPLPAFPASMPQTRLDLTVPIRFSLR
jgi:periplasmic protein TonB